MQYLGAISKHRKISVRFQDKPFNIMIIKIDAPTTNAKETEVEYFCEDLLDLRPSRTNTKKYVLFIRGDWNAEVKRYMQ